MDTVSIAVTDSWVDISTLFGLESGKSYIISNNDSAAVIVTESLNTPTNNSGIHIPGNSIQVFRPYSSSLWLRSVGNSYSFVSIASWIDSYVDPTGAQINMSLEHHKIHDGDHFNICDYTLDQAAGVKHTFVVTTPPGDKLGHLTFSVTASKGATIDLYEGASDVVGGTAIIPRNNNRASTQASVMAILKNPSSITLPVKASGFLAGGERAAGIIGRDKENILNAGTVYYIDITSMAVANDIGWCWEWYED